MAGVIPYPYRQSADFLYLTGITQPAALAVLDSSARFTLFVPDHDAWREQWDGAGLGSQAATDVFGADDTALMSQVGRPRGCWQSGGWPPGGGLRGRA